LTKFTTFTFKRSGSLFPQITRHIERKTVLTDLTISILLVLNSFKKTGLSQNPLIANQILLVHKLLKSKPYKITWILWYYYHEHGKGNGKHGIVLRPVVNKPLRRALKGLLRPLRGISFLHLFPLDNPKGRFPFLSGDIRPITLNFSSASWKEALRCMLVACFLVIVTAALHYTAVW